MKTYTFLPIALFVSVSLLSACKQKEAPSSNVSVKPQPVVVQPAQKEEKKAAPVVEDFTNKKLAAYESIYSALLNEQGGLPSVYKGLTKKGFKGNDFLYVKDLDKVVELLKKVKADTDSSLKETDQIAEKLIHVSEDILAKENAIKGLVKENEALDVVDSVKGKYPNIDKEYELALNTLSEFGADLLKNKRKLVEKKLEMLRNEGDDLRYNTEEMMLLSEELLAIFDDPKVPFNRGEAFSKGNTLVSQLESATKAQRKVIEDMKRQEIAVNPYYEQIRNNIETIISDYRQVRDARSTYAFKDMLAKYDEAVKNYNSVSVKK